MTIEECYAWLVKNAQAADYDRRVPARFHESLSERHARRAFDGKLIFRHDGCRG